MKELNNIVISLIIAVLIPSILGMMLSESLQVGLLLVYLGSIYAICILNPLYLTVKKIT